MSQSFSVRQAPSHCNNMNKRRDVNNDVNDVNGNDVNDGNDEGMIEMIEMWK